MQRANTFQSKICQTVGKKANPTARNSILPAFDIKVEGSDDNYEGGGEEEVGVEIEERNVLLKDDNK